MAYVQLATGYQQQLAGLGEQLIFPAGSPYQSGGSPGSGSGSGWSQPAVPLPFKPAPGQAMTPFMRTSFTPAPSGGSQPYVPPTAPPAKKKHGTVQADSVKRGAARGPSATTQPAGPGGQAQPAIIDPGALGPGPAPLPDDSATPPYQFETAPPPTGEESKPNYLLWGGIGIVVLAGIGYVVLSGGKKKKGRRR